MRLFVTWCYVPRYSALSVPTEAGMKLVYNEYEILPFSAGRTEILIPMDELKQFSRF